MRFLGWQHVAFGETQRVTGSLSETEQDNKFKIKFSDRETKVEVRFPPRASSCFLLLSHTNQPLPHATQGTLALAKGTMEGEISQREERGTEEERVVSCGGFSLQCGALSGDAEVAFDFSSST